MASSGLNRINIVIPGSSGNAAAERDLMGVNAKTVFGGTWTYLYYTDTVSGLGIWAYQMIGMTYNTNGETTVVTISCSGMAHPPSGSNLAAAADPGLGTTFSWSPAGAPIGMSTSGGGGGGGSAPAQNNNLWVWNIPANSSTAATDFTNAINKIQSNTALGSGYWSFFKYVDSVSGAWAVYAFAIFMGSLPQPVTYLVTCAGTPNPPTGSPVPAVSIPAFTQTFTTITAPLSFGPGR